MTEHESNQALPDEGEEMPNAPRGFHTTMSGHGASINDITNASSIRELGDQKEFIEGTRIQAKRKRTARVIGTVAALALVAGAGIFVYNSVSNNVGKGDTDVTQESQTQAQQDEQDQKIAKSENPIAAASKTAGVTKAKDGRHSTKVSATSISVDGKARLTLNKDAGLKFVANKHKCEVSKSTDYCLAAMIEGKSGTDAGVFYLPGAGHSSLFERANNFERQAVSGSAFSASVDIDTAGASQKGSLVIVNKDGSGFLIVKKDANSSTSLGGMLAEHLSAK